MRSIYYIGFGLLLVLIYLTLLTHQGYVNQWVDEYKYNPREIIEKAPGPNASLEAQADYFKMVDSIAEYKNTISSIGCLLTPIAIKVDRMRKEVIISNNDNIVRSFGISNIEIPIRGNTSKAFNIQGMSPGLHEIKCGELGKTIISGWLIILPQ